ncbi:MAG TPA: S46 family peptidase, partial [Vicinamibacterales bacterium]|nr:S46 family peptidase [Vicinamibacterales bacterium]
MSTTRWMVAVMCAVAGATLLADEGMWRIDQLPRDVIAQKYGVRLTDADLERLRYAPVRIQAGGGGGTGTFASSHGLILTNHHIALDCIRTSSLADQNKSGADNLIENGFTAKSVAEELPCKRFSAEVERSARDVTAELNAGVKPGMAIAEVQRVRQAARSDIERACAAAKGDNFSCDVVDFNSGAKSLLITYEEYKDIRLVYAPEKQFGYFGGDEMNFRFPRYADDISILRAYVGNDGAHTEYDRSHVALSPDHVLHVSMAGVKEGDFTLVAGNPGNTNRYRESYSASYNLRKGIPSQIEDLEMQLGLLRKYAAMKPEYQVALQSQIFGLANSLKSQQDVLAALKATDVVAERQRREREFKAFLDTRPDLKKEFGGVLDAQAAVYANDVEANAELDAALGWFERSDVLNYGVGLYEFSAERAKPSDRDREPQFQQRNWPGVRDALLNDDPIILPLEEDLLTIGFEKAVALLASQRIAAVQKVVARVGSPAKPRDLAKAVLGGTELPSVEVRKKLIDAAPSAFESSADPAMVFARDFVVALKDQRQRQRILNEKLLGNRSAFARGLAALGAATGKTMYPDANFTLRATYGRVAGYSSHGKAVPFATTFGEFVKFAQSRGNKGDFALPKNLQLWLQDHSAAGFSQKYAAMPVDFVTT